MKQIIIKIPVCMFLMWLPPTILLACLFQVFLLMKGEKLFPSAWVTDHLSVWLTWKTKQSKWENHRREAKQCRVLFCVSYSLTNTHRHTSSLTWKMKYKLLYQIVCLWLCFYVTWPLSGQSRLRQFWVITWPQIDQLLSVLTGRSHRGGLNLPVVFVIAVDLKSDKMLCVNSSRLLGEPVYLWNIKFKF